MKSRDISDAKLKVLRQLPAWTGEDRAAGVACAQYQAGKLDGKPVLGYLQEEGVAPSSTTETFVAIRTTVESWRWSGVPFLLRAGKQLARRVHGGRRPFSPAATKNVPYGGVRGRRMRPGGRPAQRAQLPHSTQRRHSPYVFHQAAGNEPRLAGDANGFLLRPLVQQGASRGLRAAAFGRLAGRSHALHERRRGGSCLGIRHAALRAPGRRPGPAA